MDIEIKKQDGLTVIEINGNIDGNTAPEVQEKVWAHLDSAGSLILDLSNCAFVSSAGLRVMLMLTKHLSAQGGQWALAGLNDEVKDVMDITGFSKFFQSHNSVAEARDALKSRIPAQG